MLQARFSRLLNYLLFTNGTILGGAREATEEEIAAASQDSFWDDLYDGYNAINSGYGAYISIF